MTTLALSTLATQSITNIFRCKAIDWEIHTEYFLHLFSMVSIESILTSCALFIIGPLSIAVPGEIRGYWLAHQNFGSMPWKELFSPAINMARNGFQVPESLASALQTASSFIMNETSLRWWWLSTLPYFPQSRLCFCWVFFCLHLKCSHYLYSTVCFYLPSAVKMQGYAQRKKKMSDTF